ncbi:hypothetical protein ATCVTN60342_652L [Acanthocystis turfacea Chlorella virus TN603.4.2]|nr:hypothetical protein ATCVTN60342_652L [Acanthocystis turfacea Chlorella virus TN603.4.2]
MRPVVCTTRYCPTAAKAKAFKVATSLVVPPGADALLACAIHVTDNIKIARKSRSLLLHPKLVSQSLFFYMIESGVDLSITHADKMSSPVASGVIEGMLSIVKLILLVL